ncbi:MAG: YggS family pyridoxal phosphate-dependent enzyme [Chloroflexota bacterium]
MIKSKTSIEGNYRHVRERVQRAAESVGRNPDDVKIIVVTKGHPIEKIQELLDINVNEFGENRVDEALLKVETFANNNRVQWHMIGHIQSRKAPVVSQHFNLVHSVDRIKIAQKLDQHARQANRVLPVFLQFNTSGEQTKSGWQATDESNWEMLADQISLIFSLQNLAVRGLMTMAPYHSNPEKSRPFFDRLRRLKEFFRASYPHTNLTELSMGMSGDYEIAVAEGATHLRIGTAILGAKN